MPSKSVENSVSFNCSICTFKCDNETDFKKHIENTHLKDLFKFPCHNCGLNTKGPKSLREHQRQCQIKNISTESIKVENNKVVTEAANNDSKVDQVMNKAAGPSKAVSSTTTDEIESIDENSVNTDIYRTDSPISQEESTTNSDSHTEEYFSNIKIIQADGQITDDPDQEKDEIAKSQKARKSGGGRRKSQNKQLATSNEAFTPSNDDDDDSNDKKIVAQKSRPRRNRSLINLKESSGESNDALEFILKETENQPVVRKAVSKRKLAAKIPKSAKPPDDDFEPVREDNADNESIKKSDIVDSDLSAEEEPLKQKSIKSKRIRKTPKKMQQYSIDSPEEEDLEAEDIPLKPKKTPKAQKSKSAKAEVGMAADQKIIDPDQILIEQDSTSRPKRARKTPKKLQESPALLEEDGEVSQELLAILAESDEEIIPSKKSKRRRTKSKKADSGSSSDEWKPESVGEGGVVDPSPVALSSAEVSDSDELIPDLDDDEDFEPKAVVVKGSNKTAKNTRKPRKKSVESKPAPVSSTQQQPSMPIQVQQSQHNFLVPNNEDGFEDFEPPLLVCKPPMKLKITPEKLKNTSSQSENDSDDDDGPDYEDDNSGDDDDDDYEETIKISEKKKSKRGGRAGAVRNSKNLD